MKSFVEVDHRPHATALGGDAQLDAGLAWLEKKLREAPVRPLKAGPLPPRGQSAHDGSR